MAVALYARVSTARQAEKVLSIPDQLKQMREWCEANGYLVAMEYVEPGASATDDKRPVFQQMISDALLAPAPFGAIIVHSLSRFFRDSLEFGLYERKLNKAGVKVVSITQQTSDDPAGEMARKIFSLFDEYQSKENGKHTLRAMKENARQGFFNGARPPFGYRTIEAEEKGVRGHKKRLEIDPAEAATVCRIYDLYINGHRGHNLGMKALAQHLDERGILFRGRPWRIQKLQQILSDETYVGRFYFNRRDDKTKKAKPRSEWVCTDVEPIIEAAIFERAEAVRASRIASKMPPRAVTNPTILTGLLRCGHCGAGMTLATGKGGKYRYYKCTTKMNKGVGLCDAPNLPMEKMDELVLARLAEKVFTPARVQLMLQQLQKDMKAAKSQEQAQLVTLNAEFKKLEQQLERLYEAVEHGLLPLDDTLSRRSQRLQARRQELLVEIAGTRQKVHMPANAISKRQINAFCNALKSRLMDKESGFGKRYLSLLVDEVRVEGKEATMRGSHAALAHALSTSSGGVPSFMTEWRAKQDSNE